jgi:hypothetical protein
MGFSPRPLPDSAPVPRITRTLPSHGDALRGACGWREPPLPQVSAIDHASDPDLVILSATTRSRGRHNGRSAKDL